MQFLASEGLSYRGADGRPRAQTVVAVVLIFTFPRVRVTYFLLDYGGLGVGPRLSPLCLVTEVISAGSDRAFWIDTLLTRTFGNQGRNLCSHGCEERIKIGRGQ